MTYCERLAQAFVRLADTVVADYDAAELAQQLSDSSLSLLPVAAAGIMLSDTTGRLNVVAVSGEQSRLLELLQRETDNGPWAHAFRTGEPFFVDDLTVEQSCRQEFTALSIECGFRTTAALPLRLRDERIGVLNLFVSQAGPMSDTDIAVAQALADVATIGLVQQRILMHSELINQQLQTALNSRVVIEQAKGVLAERGHIDIGRAFTLLRAHARRTNQRLTELAHAVVDGADTVAIFDQAI